MGAELAINAGEMGAGGVQADAHARGDLLLGERLGQAGDGFALARHHQIQFPIETAFCSHGLAFARVSLPLLPFAKEIRREDYKAGQKG